VGELLKFEFWRSVLVDYFYRNRIGELRCESPTFRALMLLFNIAIEESHVDLDFRNAKVLHFLLW